MFTEEDWTRALATIARGPAALSPTETMGVMIEVGAAVAALISATAPAGSPATAETIMRVGEVVGAVAGFGLLELRMGAVSSPGVMRALVAISSVALGRVALAASDAAAEFAAAVVAGLPADADAAYAYRAATLVQRCASEPGRRAAMRHALDSLARVASGPLMESAHVAYAVMGAALGLMTDVSGEPAAEGHAVKTRAVELGLVETAAALSRAASDDVRRRAARVLLSVSLSYEARAAVLSRGGTATTLRAALTSFMAPHEDCITRAAALMCASGMAAARSRRTTAAAAVIMRDSAIMDGARGPVRPEERPSDPFFDEAMTRTAVAALEHADQDVFMSALRAVSSAQPRDRESAAAVARASPRVVDALEASVNDADAAARGVMFRQGGDAVVEAAFGVLFSACVGSGAARNKVRTPRVAELITRTLKRDARSQRPPESIVYCTHAAQALFVALARSRTFVKWCVGAGIGAAVCTIAARAGEPRGRELAMRMVRCVAAVYPNSVARSPAFCAAVETVVLDGDAGARAAAAAVLAEVYGPAEFDFSTAAAATEAAAADRPHPPLAPPRCGPLGAKRARRGAGGGDEAPPPFWLVPLCRGGGGAGVRVSAAAVERHAYFARAASGDWGGRGQVAVDGEPHELDALARSLEFLAPGAVAVAAHVAALGEETTAVQAWLLRTADAIGVAVLACSAQAALLRRARAGPAWATAEALEATADLSDAVAAPLHAACRGSAAAADHERGRRRSDGRDEDEDDGEWDSEVAARMF